MRSRLSIGPMLAGVAAAVLSFGCGADAGGVEGASSSPTLDAAADRGRQVADEEGCTSCHTADGSERVGPSWKGIWGTTVRLEGGGTATVDRAYIARSLDDPDANVVDGFAPVMPSYDLSDAQIRDLAAYIEALG